jgi:hypothetical protein
LFHGGKKLAASLNKFGAHMGASLKKPLKASAANSEDLSVAVIIGLYFGGC